MDTHSVFCTVHWFKMTFYKASWRKNHSFIHIACSAKSAKSAAITIRMDQQFFRLSQQTFKQLKKSFTTFCSTHDYGDRINVLNYMELTKFVWATPPSYIPSQIFSYIPKLYPTIVQCCVDWLCPWLNRRHNIGGRFPLGIRFWTSKV